MSPKARLIGAAVLFAAWLAWLGYAAVAKSRGPVVSRSQATAVVGEKTKGVAVIAEVTAGTGEKASAYVTVVEPLTKDGPAVKSQLFVGNLPDAVGYTGPGNYLLLLVPDPFVQGLAVNGEQLPTYALAGPQRSPGYESVFGRPIIYPDSPDVRAQAGRLLK